jgi:hypothetical protein
MNGAFDDWDLCVKADGFYTARRSLSAVRRWHAFSRSASSLATLPALLSFVHTRLLRGCWSRLVRSLPPPVSVAMETRVLQLSTLRRIVRAWRSAPLARLRRGAHRWLAEGHSRALFLRRAWRGFLAAVAAREEWRAALAGAMGAIAGGALRRWAAAARHAARARAWVFAAAATRARTALLRAMAAWRRDTAWGQLQRRASLRLGALRAARGLGAWRAAAGAALCAAALRAARDARLSARAFSGLRAVVAQRRALAMASAACERGLVVRRIRSVVVRWAAAAAARAAACVARFRAAAHYRAATLRRCLAVLRGLISRNRRVSAFSVGVALSLCGRVLAAWAARARRSATLSAAGAAFSRARARRALGVLQRHTFGAAVARGVAEAVWIASRARSLRRALPQWRASAARGRRAAAASARLTAVAEQMRLCAAWTRWGAFCGKTRWKGALAVLGARFLRARLLTASLCALQRGAAARAALVARARVNCLRAMLKRAFVALVLGVQEERRAAAAFEDWRLGRGGAPPAPMQARAGGDGEAGAPQWLEGCDPLAEVEQRLHSARLLKPPPPRLVFSSPPAPPSSAPVAPRAPHRGSGRAAAIVPRPLPAAPPVPALAPAPPPLTRPCGGSPIAAPEKGLAEAVEEAGALAARRWAFAAALLADESFSGWDA